MDNNNNVFQLSSGRKSPIPKKIVKIEDFKNVQKFTF